VLIRPAALAPEHVHMVTMTMGIAASDAVFDVAGFRPLLKWPNDLFVDERKLAGILAEGLLTGPRVDAVIVGIGLNVNWQSPFPGGVSVDEVVGHDVDRAALLVALLQRFDEHYGALVERGGWRGTLLNYRRLSATLGRDVRVSLVDSSFVGRAVEITAEGHLLVETDEGMQRVAAGDVVHAALE
jgi:BirA family biotin operon repressor/biotin-[acetyl-CoA-carboxylase] ligase